MAPAAQIETSSVLLAFLGTPLDRSSHVAARPCSFVPCLQPDASSAPAQKLRNEPFSVSASYTELHGHQCWHTDAKHAIVTV